MIDKLRLEGYSYREIANTLRISINTVKSYCRRNGLTGTAERKRHICINCGTKINDGKKFCSSKCRQTWWNNNLDKVSRKAFYSFTCSYCHKPFNAYGRSIAPMNATLRIGLVMMNKENIKTFSGDGEVMLSILASFAQEEARSISNNVKWFVQRNSKKVE